MGKKVTIFAGWCAAVLLGSSAGAQVTITLEVTPASANASGGGTIVVEVFARNDGPDLLLRGCQFDLPCVLPGKPGSTGEIRAQPASECLVNADCPAGVTCNTGVNPNVCNSLSIGNTSSASSGSVPWVFAPVPPNDPVTGCGGGGCGGGLRPIAQSACRLASSPGAGEPSYIMPGGGTRRYVGTWRYEISDCAGGTFNIPYEVMNMPCQDTDLTRVVGDDNNCLPVNFVAGAFTVPVGSCCGFGTTCVCDGVNETCCESGQACPGANQWSPGRTCAGPSTCECLSNAACDDGQFCNGSEICNTATGQCTPGTPPACPGTTACTNGVCDPLVNGGAGGCIVTNKSAGTACGSGANTDCDNPDTCNGSGTCQANNEPNGTACGSLANTDCDNPDTCMGGACQSNQEANGTLCPDDGNVCTDDRCQDGACTHPNDDTNACSDGINCTQSDGCYNGYCSGYPVNGDDGLVCTLDFCDEASGGVVNIDINTILCQTDVDCPGVPCNGQHCVCADNPDVLLLPRKDANGANCHDEGETVLVDIFFGGTPATLCIAGGSFRVVYDPSCLDFVSAIPGEVPWTNEIFEQVDETTGVVFYAVGAPVGGPVKCSSDDGVMATLTFTKIGDCNSCNFCLTTQNPQHTRLVTQKGEEVLPDELGCSKPIFDAGAITINCPQDFEVNSDCNRPTAVVTWPAISFVDECDGVLQHTCHCVYVDCPDGDSCDPGLPQINCDELVAGGTFPQGSYSFFCTATDDNCDEVASCVWFLTVTDQQTLDIHLQLSPVVENDELSRCICFEMISSCSPLVVEEVCEDVVFGGPFQFPGQAEGSVKIPKGKYVCVQARDRQHSLRSTHFPLACDGHHYSVTFKGDPFFGGNWLVQGNLNGDPLIDILDFGTFMGQMNQNPTPPKNKLCSHIGNPNGGPDGRHADFNGDGVVDVQDYTFIQINFLANDKDDCCHNSASGSEAVGRTEVSVKELNDLGLGELAIADLNADGILSTEDMAAFVQGARPKGTINRGNVGRPSTIRGSR